MQNITSDRSTENHSLYIPGTRGRAPFVIGATGGSGTRVFARLFRQGGVFTGGRLNDSEDALDLAHFADRWVNTFMVLGDKLPNSVHQQMVCELGTVLSQHLDTWLYPGGPWGWKEPRSIYFLPLLHKCFPQLKYLHVVRDGRDMAISANQNQLRKHGATFLSKEEMSWPESWSSILLWNRINLQALDYAEKFLDGRYMVVRFESLCSHPHETIEALSQFFDLNGSLTQMMATIDRPPSIGRWQVQDRKTKDALHRLGGEALCRFGYMG